MPGGVDCVLASLDEWLRGRYNTSLPLPPPAFERAVLGYLIESPAAIGSLSLSRRSDRSPLNMSSVLTRTLPYTPAELLSTNHTAGEVDLRVRHVSAAFLIRSVSHGSLEGLKPDRDAWRREVARIAARAPPTASGPRVGLIDPHAQDPRMTSWAIVEQQERRAAPCVNGEEPLGRAMQKLRPMHQTLRTVTICVRPSVPMTLACGHPGTVLQCA